MSKIVKHNRKSPILDDDDDEEEKIPNTSKRIVDKWWKPSIWL